MPLSLNKTGHQKRRLPGVPEQSSGRGENSDLGPAYSKGKENILRDQKAVLKARKKSERIRKNWRANFPPEEKKIVRTTMRCNSDSARRGRRAHQEREKERIGGKSSQKALHEKKNINFRSRGGFEPP